VFVRQILITGNTVLPEAALTAVTQDYINRPVTSEELEALRLAVSGELKLYQDRQFKNEPFSSWHPERKFTFLSVFFVSHAMTRGCESSRRDPQQI
jgi:hypothetical protein